MKKTSEIIGNIPIISSLYKEIRRQYYRYQLRSEDKERVFTAIYKNNKWGSRDSVSGPGSDLVQTRVVREKLPDLLRDFSVTSMLDIPCGDFNWMKDVDLDGINYIGGDIVKDLIADNEKKHASDNRRFLHLNLMKDELPKVDLIFCRDCLVHFSINDMLVALDNICKSQAEYLLTTTFIEQKENHDITTGQWHPINLEKPPFSFPEPLSAIIEGCTEGGSTYRDKAIGLWKVSDIRKRISGK